MGIELIGHEYPTRIGIGFDSGCKVGSEIRFGSRRSDRRADDFAGAYNKGCSEILIVRALPEPTGPEDCRAPPFLRQSFQT